MLTSIERAAVQEALFLDFSAEVNHRALMGVIFGPAIGDILPRLPPVPGTGADAERIVSICLGSGWNRTPALMSMLLDYLVVNKGHGELEVARARVVTGVDPNPVPFGMYWLSVDRPFFDRVDLRGPLQDLIEKEAQPILLIQAPKGSFGRSYTRELIEDVARQRQGTIKAAPVVISPKTGLTYDVTDLALDIVTQAGVIDGPPERSDSSYPRAVARFVLGRLLNNGAQWVIVLDGFGQELKAEVRETIGMLATFIAETQFKSGIRLVLIDYPRALLPDTLSAANILEESLVPAKQIVADDIRPALLAIAKRRADAGKTPIPEADLAPALDRILGQAPPSGKKRLEKLNEGLSKVWAF